MYDRKLNGCRQRLLFARQLTQRKCSLSARSRVTQSMTLTVESLKELLAKEFLPNIRKEIGQEIDSLKASLLDLKKKIRRNLKVPKFYLKET